MKFIDYLLEVQSDPEQQADLYAKLKLEEQEQIEQIGGLDVVLAIVHKELGISHQAAQRARLRTMERFGKLFELASRGGDL